ncbi:MAG: nicotinamide mononucleotide transporter [Clostridia bacterium]|nr:nicotinamide mononucleotide transporter [Clostridia bacterium]MBQ9773202.1 nicotinamide mononucleotide transporter [Clostridia bacterium]
MNYQNPFRALTRWEWALWCTSLAAVTLSFVLGSDRDVLTFIATLIGVTALIFLAKGDVLGQGLVVIFAVLYAIVSWRLRYYGEVITYVGMSAPIALLAIVSWLRHPSAQGHNEVEVARVSARAWWILGLLTVLVTAAFYFILRHFNTANLIPSTVSVATSFLAASLTFLRSPYYGLGYAANDVVLIVLWLMAAIKEPQYYPMVLCFVTFLANDLYGFFNWQRMQKRQEKG